MDNQYEADRLNDQDEFADEGELLTQEERQAFFKERVQAHQVAGESGCDAHYSATAELHNEEHLAARAAWREAQGEY